MKKLAAEKIWLIVIVALSLAKLCRLNGGVILAEPDERIYLEAAGSLGGDHSFFPYLSGIPFFYGLPLHTYLIWFLLKFFPQGYLASRLVSVLSALFLTGAFWHYARQQFGSRAGRWVVLFLSLCPFAIFYSRVGVIEMLVTALGFASWMAFDHGLRSRNRKHLFMGGVLLGLAVLCKYTALVFGVVEGVMLGVRIGQELLTGRERSLPARIGEAWRKYRLAAASLALSVALVVPVAFAFYYHSPSYFAVQTKKSLGLFDDFWRNFGGTPEGFGRYASLAPWWVGWPILILGLVGGVWLLVKEWRRRWSLLLVFGLYAWLAVTRAPFSPRYFFPVVPFLCLFAGIGLDKAQTFLERRRLFLFPFIFSLSSFALVLPGSWTAFQATQHRLVEEVGQYIYSQSGPNAWIFSNFWPNYFGQAAQSERATWLANSVWETGAFVDTERSALEILEQEGGWVVFEELYSTTLVHPPERTEAWQVIRDNYQPVKVIGDSAPNFPEFPVSYNQTEIYHLPSKAE